jgi:hypothetical protein
VAAPSFTGLTVALEYLGRRVFIGNGAFAHMQLRPGFLSSSHTPRCACNLRKDVTMRSQNPVARTANTLGVARCCALLALAFAGAAWADDGFPQDPRAWLWPDNVPAAAHVYQCSLAKSRLARDLVMVWTDQTNKVVAFGALVDRGQTPAYAQALGHAAPAKFANGATSWEAGFKGSSVLGGTRAADEGTDPINLVRLAGRGHEVIATGKVHSLKIMDTTLVCIPSLDE